MLTKKHVLVLGAGASEPYNFPTGAQLSNLVAIELLEGHNGHNRLIAAGLKSSDIRQFRDAFFRSGKNSVDAFLEHRTDLIEIGKLGEFLRLKHRALANVALVRARRLVQAETVDDPFADSWIKIDSEQLEKLKSQKDVAAIKRKYDNLGGQGFDWLNSAFQKINRTIDKASVDSALAKEITEAGASNDAADDEVEKTESPASDDAWQPIAIDRSSEAYAQAVSATEEALQIIEGNNGYAQSEPEERNGILESAKGTLKAIKEGTPSVGAIKAGLLAPLKYLSNKFVDAAIGVAAKQALEKLLTWISTLL